jgi:hypothetical protein
MKEMRAQVNFIWSYNAKEIMVFKRQSDAKILEKIVSSLKLWKNNKIKKT